MGACRVKLLIVDDEKHVITAIRCLLPAKQLGITEILSAQTSAEAKILLEKERPEIAIVDIILQNQTGMNLLAFILNKRLPTLVIAISGHSDYEYVRTMLLNGAVDYLLKPVEAQSLIHSIQKAIARLPAGKAEKPREREPEPMMSMNLSTQYVRTLLRRMLTPAHEQSAYAELSNLDSQFADLRHCMLLYYDLDYLPMRSGVFRQHLSMFEEKVISYLSLHKCGFFLDKFSSQHERLLLVLGEDTGHRRQIESMAISAFASTAHVFHMGCAGRVQFPAGFRQGFAQARNTFFADDCQMTPEMIQEHPGAAQPRKVNCSPELERRLLSLVVAQDHAGVAAAAEEWLNALLSDDVLPLGLVRNVVDAYNAMYFRWVARIREIRPGFSASSASEAVSYADFLDEYFAFSRPMMAANIIRSLRLFTGRVGKAFSDTDIFRQIAFYMELNFDQPFNQAEYARIFHLNKDYLSRKFKQMFGEGMISYMNRLRIHHAKEMMRDATLKIRDIAYQTGFGDEKYFARQFKAFMQITPSEYHAMLQANEKKGDD